MIVIAGRVAIYPIKGVTLSPPHPTDNNESGFIHVPN